MKEISNIKPVYLGKYDVHVNPYLTYAEIQQVANAVKDMDAWAERQQGIDMLVLHHATDISDDELEKYGHDMLLCSGLIDAVYDVVQNIGSIYDALNYGESLTRIINRAIKESPKQAEQVKNLLNKNNGADS